MVRACERKICNHNHDTNADTNTNGNINGHGIGTAHFQRKECRFQKYFHDKRLLKLEGHFACPLSRATDTDKRNKTELHSKSNGENYDVEISNLYMTSIEADGWNNAA